MVAILEKGNPQNGIIQDGNSHGSALSPKESSLFLKGSLGYSGNDVSFFRRSTFLLKKKSLQSCVDRIPCSHVNKFGCLILL